MDPQSSTLTLAEMMPGRLLIARAHRVVEFTLEDLEWLRDHESVKFGSKKDQIFILFQDLKFIESFIRTMQESSNHHRTVLRLVAKVIEVLDRFFEAIEAYLRVGIEVGPVFGRAELVNMIESAEEEILEAKGGAVFGHYPQKIADLVNMIKSVEEDILDVYIDGSSREVGNSSNQKASSSSAIEETIVVGFEDEQKELLDRLIGGWKQLEVIPIIGMAGIGKTTLANKLYNHSSVVHQFHIRSWTSVSQLYQKKNLLHNILSSIVNENDPALFMSEDELGEKLYKCLMGNRYLIVIDDIWDIQAWNDLEIYFPKNENGSRILMTSRIEDVALNIRTKSNPYYLRFLTEDESWDLFQSKVFVNRRFPEELRELGKKIVARCKGLPLLIVVIAGLLAKEEKTQHCWRQVAENMGSSINNEQLMETLALSYEHLPSWLKPCFVYFGSFLEDYEIPVTTLIRSWIAEGFIQQTKEKRLEEVAEEYLFNLVNRNLVMIAKRSADCGIKSCCIHDLLRDLCLKKSKEEEFAELAVRWNKLLRVLDLRHIKQDNFPEEILNFLHLKFLALQVDRVEMFPPLIFNLWNLETFILEGEKGRRLELTPDILKLKPLRHFQISQELFCDPGKWMDSLRKQKVTPTTILDNLQTFSVLCPSHFVVFHLLSMIPSLKKLGLHLTLSETTKYFRFPNLSISILLETLNFEYQTLGMVTFGIPHPHVFPPSLKKLTLIGSHADWSEMSILGMLPNLEVLKLKDNFFSGPCWETSDEGFLSLKFLKLSHMDLQQWISSSSHFPKLEQLVLNGCLELQQIPLDLADILTLQVIEVYRSSDSVVESAKEIQETRESVGNDDLKVFIYQHFQEY